MENEIIENLSQLKKIADNLGFGESLHAGIEHSESHERGLFDPILAVDQPEGLTEYQPKIAFGEARGFFNGYQATLFTGLHLDHAIDDLSIRDLVDRMTMTADQLGIARDKNFEGAIKSFNEQVRADLQKVHDNDENLFYAITARYGLHGLEVDSLTLAKISTYGIENTQSRWFSADEKITITEAARMLVKSDTPAAVRKDLLEYRPIEDVLADYEKAGLGSASEIFKEWEQLENKVLQTIDKQQLKEHTSKIKTLRRFATFMKPYLKADTENSVKMMERMPTWLSIDFGAPRTASDNLSLNRVADPGDFLRSKYGDYIWTEPMTKKEYWNDIRDLKEGKTITLESTLENPMGVNISVNPTYKTLHIRDVETGELQSHHQFRTQEARQRYALKGDGQRQPPAVRMVQQAGSPEDNPQKKSPAVTPAANKGKKASPKKNAVAKKNGKPTKRAPANKKGAKRSR